MFNLEEVAQLWMIYYQSWKVFAEAGLCGYLMLVLISVCSNHGWCRQVSLSTSLQFRISRWTGDTGQVFINQFSVSAFFLNVKWRKCPVEILQTFCFQWYNEVRCKSYFIHLPTKFYCILIWYLCICLKSSSLLLNIFMQWLCRSGSGVRCVISLSNWSMFTLLDVEVNNECGRTNPQFQPRNVFPGYRSVKWYLVQCIRLNKLWMKGVPPTEI